MPVILSKPRKFDSYSHIISQSSIDSGSEDATFKYITFSQQYFYNKIKLEQGIEMPLVTFASQ